jgi:hypothetical protein
MSDAGRIVDDGDVLDILRLHAAYLAAAPPDQAFEDGAGDATDSEAPPDDERIAEGRRWVAVPETRPGGESTVSRR